MTYYPDWTVIEISGRDYKVKGYYPEGKYEKLLVPSPPSYLYLHVNMADGDNRDPLGIKNNGNDHITFTATFRQSADPASAVITQIDGLSWRVNIRDDQGFIYDIIDVEFTAGVAVEEYSTDQKPAVCQVLESDFEAIKSAGTTYQIKLVGEILFKVYRKIVK